MNEDKAREAFEAHMKGDWRGRESAAWRNPDGSYIYTESEWRAFQAALQWAASQQAPKTAEEMRPDFEWWWQTRGIFPPLGTREAAAAWGAWLASGGYKAPSDWKLSPAPWGWDAAVSASQQAAEGWRPIETAPKDGTDVLVMYMHIDTQIVHNAFYASEVEGWDAQAVGWWSYDHSEVSRIKLDDWMTPTHWMPLPAAPTAQGERDEQ